MLNKLDTSQLQAAELLRSQAPDAGATVVNTSLHRDLKLAGKIYSFYTIFLIAVRLLTFALSLQIPKCSMD